jgi:predicted TIM-barrel fold metal-dependent hydrolase
LTRRSGYVRGDLLRKNVDTDIFADMWAAIIEKYPDRFMIGTDKVGHWTDYPHEIGKYYMLIDKLKPETARKLCRENVLALLGKS